MAEGATDQPKRLWSGAPRWAKITLVVLGLIVAVFAIRVALNNQSLVGSVHQRNYHNLDVAARTMQDWPVNIGQIARNARQFEDPRFHPDIGAYRITNANCRDIPDVEVFRRGLRPGQGLQFRIAGWFRPGQDSGIGRPPTLAPKGAKCYFVEVPLDRLINLREAAPEFSHLLILASDGNVVAQIGESELPLTQITEFAPPDAFIGGLARQFIDPSKVPITPDLVKLGDAGGKKILKEIGGQRYRAYVKPFKIQGMANACPTLANSSAGGSPDPSARAAPSIQGSPVAVAANVNGVPSATAKPATSGMCYAVGLMPDQRLRDGWLSPPPALLIGFGLALVGFVALFPLVRLLLIGSGESVSLLEAGGIAFGVQAATAIAMLGVLYFGETAAERASAKHEAAEVAQRIASQATREMEALLDAFPTLQSLNLEEAGEQGIKIRGKEEKDLGGLILSGGTTDLPKGKSVRERKGVVKHLKTLELFAIVKENGDLVSGQKGGDFNTVPAGIIYYKNAVLPQSIANRDYFTALKRGEILQYPENCGQNDCKLGYTLGQVRAQTDGSSKTVFAFKRASGDEYVVAAAQINALLSPVLPYPLRYAVVDLGQPELPVLFHSNRYRAGAEKFAERVEGGGAKLAALRALSHSANPKPLQFSLRYDGERSEFVALPLRHTKWALLVFFPRDSVDAIAAGTALRALISWLSLALIACLIGILWTWRHPEDWRELWPDQVEDEIYVDTLRHLWSAAAIGGSIAGLAALGLIEPWAGLLAAIATWIGAIVWFNIQLRDHPQTAKALTPRTERNYGWLVLTLLVCVAAIPMLALWADSRALSRDLADGRRSTEAAKALVERFDRRTATMRTMGGDEAGFEKEANGLPDFPASSLTWGGAAPITAKRIDEKEDASQTNFTRSLWSFQFFLPESDFRRCAPPLTTTWLCLPPTAFSARSELPRQVAIVPRSTTLAIGGSAWIGLGIIAAALAALIVSMVLLGLRALMGFGVPLGAVKLESFNPDEIPKRTLLVAPQAPVRWYFGKDRQSWSLDLSDILLATPNGELSNKVSKQRFDRFCAIESKARGAPPRLLVSGLSLILRDPERRRAALKMLETADRALERGELAAIVIISDFSPLERILDAFENEESSDSASLTVREELRWARLFQRFSTKQFGPVEKVYMRPREDDQPLAQTPWAKLARIGRRLRALFRPVPASDETAAPASEIDKCRLEIKRLHRGSPVDRPHEHGTYTLIEELRWLPSGIIDSLLETDLDPKKLVKQGTKFPIEAPAYQDIYTAVVLKWAKNQNVPSPAAAIDYLRSILIEYYEQCWASSTLSERLVLEAVARGHFVNMHHAIALQSLVRRGLIILDPAPRLMNRSFAQFVSQAERPDTLRKWRAKQPKSGWLSARMPLVLGIAVGALFLSISAAQSGQEISAMLALLVAGGPTLLNTLFRALRPMG